MEQNINQAKFLIKELLAILELIQEKEYDNELLLLIDKLVYKIV